MTDDEQQIRNLIEGWAEAVPAAISPACSRTTSDDIVMFDVPPPYEGVRGIDYRETWPPFFVLQARGASFEIVSLDVTAGDDVAYIHNHHSVAERAGTRRQPAEPLAPPVGLRKEGWALGRAHEHLRHPTPASPLLRPAAPPEAAAPPPSAPAPALARTPPARLLVGHHGSSARIACRYR